MKTIDYSNISATVGQPFKSGTWKHLQEAYTDIFAGMMRQINGGVALTANVAYVLYGLVNTGAGANRIITAGAIIFNGEIYFIPAATFTISGGNVAAAVIISTPFTSPSADPVVMTDGSTPSVHLNRTVNIIDGNSGSPGYIADYAAFVSLGTTFLKDSEYTATDTFGYATETIIHAITIDKTINADKMLMMFQATLLNGSAGGTVFNKCTFNLYRNRAGVRTVLKVMEQEVLNDGSAHCASIIHMESCQSGDIIEVGAQSTNNMASTPVITYYGSTLIVKN